MPPHNTRPNILRTIRIALGDLVLLDYLFDWRFGTETVARVRLEDLDVHSARLASGYQGTRALALRRLFRKLNLGPDRVLLDLGSGKGRVLLVAALCGFKEAHGVDWSEALCRVAERNIAAFRHRTGSQTVFKVYHSDASDYVIQSTEDVFYLFQPFDEVVLAHVLQNIRGSVGEHPRQVWIICEWIDSRWGRELDEDPKLTKVVTYHTLRQQFHVYSNQP